MLNVLVAAHSIQIIPVLLPSTQNTHILVPRMAFPELRLAASKSQLMETPRTNLKLQAQMIFEDLARD